MTWNIVRSLVKAGDLEKNVDCIDVNGIIVDDAKSIANKFNDYFTSIGHSLALKILKRKIPYQNFMKSPPLQSFGLRLTSAEELIALSKSFKVTHSTGVDGIDPYLAGPTIDLIASPLAQIINCSFLTGTVPDGIKVAKVVPIFKSGGKEIVNNYRPISILPFFQSILKS
jgi:hypothetical protein